MRLELLYNPKLLIERLAEEVSSRVRLSKLKGTCAHNLELGYLGTLELLELTRIKEPQIVYDIGAYKGTWSLLTKAILPHATIHAFEPLRCHLAQLYPGLEKISDITFHQIALGQSYGLERINIANRSDASSILGLSDKVTLQYGVEKKTDEFVELDSLDHYVSRQNLPLPDLIKLDVQGYELEVLKGAINCLHQASWVLCEVSFQQYYVDQALFHDVVNFLSRHNYHIYAFGMDTKLGKVCSQTDVLFHRIAC